MANSIRTLKEDNEDITYPVTKAGAVYLNNGTDAESKFATCVTAQNLAVTTPETPLVGTNMINDGAVTSDKIDWTTVNVIDTAYHPGEVVTLGGTVSLTGFIDGSDGRQKWFIPLNKDLQFVTGCTIRLAGTTNSYYFFSINQDVYAGWGRQTPGTYTGTLNANGVSFTTPVASGTSNGRLYQYTAAVGMFSGVEITFS